MTNAPETGLGLRVLVVEDEALIAEEIQDRLTRSGYRIIGVRDTAEEAIRAAEALRPELVLMDIRLNGKMDGIEAASHIYQQFQIPVVYLTAHSDPDTLQRAKASAPFGYVLKPFQERDLLVTIEIARHRHELFQHLKASELKYAAALASLEVSIATQRRHDRETVHFPQHPPAPAAPTIFANPSSFPEDDPQGAAFLSPTTAIPHHLGRIKIERWLGSGGMSHVYLGHHELLDLPVAVKVLRPEFMRDPEMTARFLREARLAMRVGHCNIVRLLEVGETADSCYLAFEFIEGGTLEQLQDRLPNRQLDIAGAVRITRAVATVLAELNWLGITHRDIKPSNILLTNTDEVKVADLGLARYSNTATAPSLTGEFFVVGTPVYMSPEQAGGNKGLDIGSDLYSLGVVLYEMLTGTPPFTGPMPMAILAAHMFSPVTPPSQLRPDVPPWLDAVRLKLLAKARIDRYPLPEMLLEELRAHGG